MSTIVALSTPPGRSAIALIRLSGPSSLQIVSQLVPEPEFQLNPRQATLRTIHDPATAEVVDQVLLTSMPAPNSFTGEDVVEISCHGAPVIVRRIIDLVLAQGARLAGPGEFTLRAVANGRLDLSQAEAIRDLVNAQTEIAARQAMRQLNGELSAMLQRSKQQLIEVIVQLESAVEFVEDDLPQVQGVALAEKLRTVAGELKNLASSFSLGHWLKDGIRVTIAGRPNVGKSSLFNSLLRYERAIVTAVPGTTRDTISETIDVRGMPVVLTDTAGVRRTFETVETIGIERANRAIADADLVLLVIDGSVELTEEDRELFSQIRDSRYLVVANKSDLPQFEGDRTPKCLGDAKVVQVSALLGSGLDRLHDAMLDQLGFREHVAEGLLITDARHYDLLCRSVEQLQAAIAALGDRVTEELVLVNLHNALTLLGAITGETTTEDILTQIFQTFCIGK